MSDKENWELVQGSWRNTGYYRRIARTRAHPTLYQRQFRNFAARAGRQAIGQTGLAEYRGKLIPPMAVKVAEQLTGKKFAPKKLKPAPEVLTRLKPVLEGIGKAVESMKPINRHVIPRLLLWERLQKEKRMKASKVTA